MVLSVLFLLFVCDMFGRNNPFNLTYEHSSRWLGTNGFSRDGFSNFTSLVYGVRAAAVFAMRYLPRKNKVTYSQIIESFVDSGSYDAQNIVCFICEKLHVLPFDKPSTIGNFCGLLHWLWFSLSGSPWSANHIKYVIDIYNIRLYGKK